LQQPLCHGRRMPQPQQDVRRRPQLAGHPPCLPPPQAPFHPFYYARKFPLRHGTDRRQWQRFQPACQQLVRRNLPNANHPVAEHICTAIPLERRAGARQSGPASRLTVSTVRPRCAQAGRGGHPRGRCACSAWRAARRRRGRPRTPGARCKAASPLRAAPCRRRR